MRPISDRLAKAFGTSHAAVTKTVATLPTGENIDLALLPGSTVTASSGEGVRYTASLNIAPIPGVNLYDKLATPGTMFHIKNGVDFGGSDHECVPVFTGNAITGKHDIVTGQISLTLADQYDRIGAVAFLQPFVTRTGTRATHIKTVVEGALPGVVVKIINDGGTATMTGVWDRSRTDLIKLFAKDGSLDCGFDAAGVFVIRTIPKMANSLPVWDFRTGETGNITSASRERPFAQLFNTVVVSPMNDSQAWLRQVVSITSQADPRHPSKIGIIPYPFSSPTLVTAVQARAAGEAILRQVIGITEKVSLGALANPALEVGDVATVRSAATDSDPGFAATHILDGWTLDLATGHMTLDTRTPEVTL